MSKYFIHDNHVREYTNMGHKGLSPLALVRKLNKLEKENAELREALRKLKKIGLDKPLPYFGVLKKIINEALGE